MIGGEMTDDWGRDGGGEMAVGRDDCIRDERVANRLLDQLGTKTLDKSNAGPSTCEPSTSSEEDYEVIDGEIRIHYTNYEREPTHDYNNETPPETRTAIPRRPSMEEMSLIFPGFLPIITEEEECYEETFNDENVDQTSSDGTDNIESNVNIFIEHESSNECNKSQTNSHKLHQEKEEDRSVDSSRVVTNRKGKQPIGYVSTETRRRHVQKDLSDLQEIQPSDRSPREMSGDKGNYVRDSKLSETAVLETTSSIKNTHQREENTGKVHNKKQDNFISGDPINQTSIRDPKHDLNTLMIIDESTVALETLSPDANENTNLNTADQDTPSETASSSFAAKNDTEQESSGFQETAKWEKSDDCEIVNGPVSSSAGKKFENMTTIEQDQLTHSWTFYAMSDTNSNIENYLEHSDRTNDQQDIPQIVVDFCPEDKKRNCNILEHNSTHNTAALDSFETDIDVDDMDLDELNNDNITESDDFNCFVKRHVSVTDLDKILTSQDIAPDNTGQYNDDINNDIDPEELEGAVILPAHKTNNETIKDSPTGDRKIVNESKQSSHTVLTGDLIFSYTTMSGQVSNGEDSTSKECEGLNARAAQSKQIVPLANKQQQSINNDDNASKNAMQTEVKLKEYSNRDFANRDSDKKKLEQITDVENYINTINKDSDNYNATIKETTSTDTKHKSSKTTKVEVKKGIYSYKCNDDIDPDLKVHQTITEQEAYHRNLSSIDSALSNVTNNEPKNKICSCSNVKDKAVITDKNDKQETASRTPTERSSIWTDSTEKNVGLTAEELRSKVDLSKPVYTSSRNEVIIGRKKSRKESAGRLFTYVTPGNETGLSRDATSSNATKLSRNDTPSYGTELSRKSSETSRRKSESSHTTSKLSRSKSEPSRRAVEQAIVSPNVSESSIDNSESSLYSSRTSRSISEHSFVTHSVTKQSTSRTSVHQTDTVPSKPTRGHAITSRIAAEQVGSQATAVVDGKELHVTQPSDVKQPGAKHSNNVTSKKNNAMNWTPKLAKTRELQTLISIKDIPDSKVGVNISTTTPIDAAKPRKTSTGLDKAEEIVAKRKKRLEEVRKNGKVHENFTPVVSKTREIDWNSFLVDGLMLEKVDNTREKTRDNFRDDIVLTPPLARKPIVKNNETQVCESFTQKLFNPRELDWDWFEREDKHAGKQDNPPSHVVKSRGNFTYDTNDNVQKETDSIMQNSCANRENDLYKTENKTNYELHNNDNVVVVTNCVKNKEEHYSNDIATAGVNLNDPTTNDDNNEETFPTKDESSPEDNDVFSYPSYPSSEPEFPVRLTKSFSELRNVEMQLNHSREVESNFQRPDRSKSQTDVFAPQGSQHDAFDESEDHVFQTKITVDEVYKNRRRIVILNVRKKSPGKTRWKSLSDLESAKKHVFRFRSIGSHSELAEERLSAGDESTSFAENKDIDFTPTEKIPISLSHDYHHSNDPSVASAPSSQQDETTSMESTVKNCDFTLQSQPTDLHMQESTCKTSEQLKQEGDLPSRATRAVDVESTLLSSESTHLETTEQKLCEEIPSQDDFTSTEDKSSSASCYRVSSPTESEVEISQLQRQASLSPVQELIKQTTENRSRSPGTTFAVSRHSPTPLTDIEVEKSLQRLPSPPPILPDIDKQDDRLVTSQPSPGTANIINDNKKGLSDGYQMKDMSDVVNNKAESNKDPKIEMTSQLSKRNAQKSTKSETVSTISIDSTASMNTQPLAQRQSSLSPVNDIIVRRSPSPIGTIFAVRRQSPSPVKDHKGENSSPRRSSLSPVKDVKESKYGKIFAVSRHSPTPLSDTERKTIREKITPPSPVQFTETVPEMNRKNYDAVPSVTSRRIVTNYQSKDYRTELSLHSRKPIPSNNQSKKYDTEAFSTNSFVSKEDNYRPKESDSTRLTGASYESKLPDYNKRSTSYSQNEKDKDADKSSLITPGLTETIRESYTSRHSSASSSGYGGSRISPSSSLDRRCTWEKPSKPPLSPDLVSEGKKESTSRRSSASSGSVFLSRVSPTPSTDSECSTGRQRGSYRSGTVFAISGYSSAASDSESKRPGSVSPINIERKHTAQHFTKDRDSKERSKTTEKELLHGTSKYKEIASRGINESRKPASAYDNEWKYKEGDSKERNKKDEKEITSPATMEKERPKELPVLSSSELSKITNTASHDQTSEVKHSVFNRLPSYESENDFNITQDGWLVKKKHSLERTSDQTFRTHEQENEADDHASRTKDERKVFVTDLDSLLNGTSTTASTKSVVSEENVSTSKEKEAQLEATDILQSRAATTISPTGVQETDLDAIFDSDSSSSKEDKDKGATEIPRNNATQSNKIVITSIVTSADIHTMHMARPDVADCNSTPSPMLDDLDEDIFTRINPKTKRDPNDMTFSSDADSETSSLNSVPVKSKVKHTKASLEAVKPAPQRLSQSSDSSSATPSTPEKVESQFMFLHPDLTSTPEVINATEITKYSTSLTSKAAKEPSQRKRQDNSTKGNNLLTDSSYGAVQVKTRSTSDTRVISTEASKSAFTPVRNRTNDRRSVSQEFILDSITNQEESTPNYNAIEESAFKDLADSHKSMPDLHKAHDDDEVVGSPQKTVPYHSRLSAHTRLWLSQTAGIDTSDLKDDTGGSEIFLFPSKRFQPGKNVDASFLSIASEGKDIPDNVSSRPSSPMSEFSFAGDAPFGTEADSELRIIACGHRFCDQEEIIRGQEKTTFTSCPACYTYYCSRECRQAHWKEHKKFCYFGRINSYMRSFVYFCHKKDNLRLLLSNIALKHYASKGRGSVMVTFASPKQARKFMTSGCVLLPSPPSYSTVRELMQEGVVSKHKVNLVHQVKDYDPTKEFVLNLAVVAGKLEDLPRHPVPRHKLNTVLECIKVPLSESVIEQPKRAVPDTSKETRVFYLPKCSRHGFINDMEARRHYCRNISKSLKAYGIRLKKDYPEAYDCLCLYVEKNKSFKPLTVYGNEGSKIITCKIMPEASISAV